MSQFITDILNLNRQTISINKRIETRDNIAPVAIHSVSNSDVLYMVWRPAIGVSFNLKLNQMEHLLNLNFKALAGSYRHVPTTKCNDSIEIRKEVCYD